MNSAGTGGKAGALSGLIFGVIDSVFGVLALIEYRTQVQDALSRALQGNTAAKVFTPSELYHIVLITTPIIGVLAGVIIGLVLGLIFGAFYSKLPGKTAMIKGLFFGVILWVIFDVGIGAADVLTYGYGPYLFNLGTGIIAVLIFGYFLGLFYSRWVPEDEFRGEKNTLP